MKRILLGISILAMTALSAASAFADVKVKSKQTVGGQSYESTTYIKGKRQRSESFGGMVNIIQCDLKRNLQINQNSQTYMITPFAATTQTVTKPGTSSVDKSGVVQTGGRVTTTVTTKDTGERKQMFGYTARHLIITIETISSPDACSKTDSKMQTDGWYIDAAFALDCDYGVDGYGGGNNKKSGCQDKYDVKTIGTAKRGFAVYEETTMFDASGREMTTMVNEVVELSQATLEVSLFDIPAGYREVNDASEMYAMPTTRERKPAADETSGIGITANVRAANAVAAAAEPLGPKKAGVIRIGIANVRTGAVGEGISAADLSAAIRNSLMQYLKIPKVEVVALEARLDSAVESEAQSKECDFVAYLTASHKKGGGGFGMFKSLAPVISSVIPAAGAAGAGGYIAGQAVVTAATVSAQVKNKDEITLGVKLNKTGGTATLDRTLKSKAKSNGDDIISQIVEQAAQAIVAAIGLQ